MCDDWWDVTESNHFVTTVAQQVVKDTLLRSVITRTQKYTVIAIGIV